MLTQKELVRYSKFLSLVLRHRPDMLDIQLDAAGWVDVALLLQRMHQKGFAIDEAILNEVVAHNNKQRFALSADGRKIRASQGHSVRIDLGYTPEIPPPVLYHGTAEKYLTPILQQGLQKGRRHHVHLSTDAATAKSVGSRHGKPVVLQIDAARMHSDGHLFYQSTNGVWLTHSVPSAYIQVVNNTALP